MNEQEMEAQLKTLVERNGEANRAVDALNWKARGRKVMGVVCSYIPDELIYAAGMLPWRVTGRWGADVTRSRPYRPTSCELYYTHALEAGLSGDLSFLDGAVFTDRDNDMRRFYDVWKHTAITPFTYILHLPHHDRAVAQRAFRREIHGLAAALEGFSGVRVTEEMLCSAIGHYNTTRKLLQATYEMRKRPVPPLTGAEYLGLTLAARIMPVEEFNQKLERILPHLENRMPNFKATRPRILVSSDALDDPRFLKIIEDLGSVVAMDDLDTGSRWFTGDVPVAWGDPSTGLAQRYLFRPACPRMYNWDKQLGQVLDWVRDYDIDGVIDLTARNNYFREFRRPYFAAALSKAGVATISLQREYGLADVAQLQTRIGAFLEMLKTK